MASSSCECRIVKEIQKVRSDLQSVANVALAVKWMLNVPSSCLNELSQEVTAKRPTN